MLTALFVSLFIVVGGARCQTKECCDKIEAAIKKKENAYNILCAGQPSYQDCCDDMKSNLEKAKEVLSNQCPPCEQYSFLFPERDEADYLAVRNTPSSQMTAFSACFWVKSDDSGNVAFLSYSVPGMVNELVIFGLAKTKEGTPLYLMINNYPISSVGLKNVVLMDGQWHSVCVTWSNSRGRFDIYIDGKVTNTGNLLRKQKITAGGDWYVGTSKSNKGLFTGELANVNVWDKVLSAEEVEQFANNCGTQLKGNIVDWDSFKSGKNGAVEEQEKSTCCAA